MWKACDSMALRYSVLDKAARDILAGRASGNCRSRQYGKTKQAR